ncbi:hypothetical protein Micbo1qcDRAFT_164822 [Microdochium bolleyi]|uniref:C6 zinc finger domain-containing protein n=1 Tax=Microdochium bolleyi TaxID=196109 RepID=A0A136IZE3_9PEZI|nr:hypothetical protein Micbo1qcDRAFT_164822 [Microdochium bolleyi]
MPVDFLHAADSGPRRVARLVEPTGVLMAGAPLSARDSQYFDHFRNHVIYQLGGAGFGDVWGRTILREGSRDPCVFNAILGLGALYRAKSSPAAAQLTIPLCKTRVNAPSPATRSPDHYYEALAYYTAAISRFQKRIAVNDPYTPRAVLIFSMLLSTFESLQGDIAAADQLTAHAIIALRDLLLRRRTRPRAYPSPATSASSSPSAPSTPRLSKIVSELANSNFPSSPHGNSRERESLIAAPLDDEGVREAEFALVRNVAFNVALTPFYPRAREALLAMKFDYLDRAPRPPTIEECRISGGSKVFWRDVVRFGTMQAVWSFHVRAIMHATLFANPHLSGAEFLAAVPDMKRHKSDQAGFLLANKEWMDALEKHPQLVSDSDESALTKAMAKGLAIVLNVSYWSLSSWLDHPSEFQLKGDYAAAAAALLDQNELTIMYLPAHLRDQGTSQDGLIPTLATPAQQSPHRALRLRALELWDRIVSPRSSWLVRGMYLGTKALVEAEEVHRDPVTNRIPTHKQYAWTKGDWSPDYAQLHVTLTGLVPDEHGNRTVKTVTVDVPSE